MQIINGKIITPDAVLTDHTLIIDGSRISAIVPTQSAPPDDEIIDAQGQWVVIKRPAAA